MKTPARLPRSADTATAGRRRKADDVIDALGMGVVAGRFGKGGQLPTEAELTRAFGVSRPSLREGLKALERKGLVESRARRGTVALDKQRWDVLDADVLRWMAAAPPDEEFLIDVVEARKIFEPAAARLAAQRATPAQILTIEGAYRGMVESLPEDVDACCAHDLAFHESIIAASGNVLLIRLATAIRTALLSLFRLSYDARASYESSLAEHGAVAVAIRRRDPEAAALAMRQLLEGTVRDLKPAFEPGRAVRSGKPESRRRGSVGTAGRT